MALNGISGGKALARKLSRHHLDSPQFLGNLFKICLILQNIFKKCAPWMPNFHFLAKSLCGGFLKYLVSGCMKEIFETVFD